MIIDESNIHEFLMNNGNRLDCVDKGITEITHAPAGCLLIKRAVFETLKEKHPDLKIKQKTVINGEYVDKTNYYNFFDCIHDKKTQTYMGEDYGFCKLWTDLGGKVYGLVDQYIMHAGEHQYIGRFIDEFERKEVMRDCVGEYIIDKAPFDVRLACTKAIYGGK